MSVPEKTLHPIRWERWARVGECLPYIAVAVMIAGWGFISPHSWWSVPVAVMAALIAGEAKRWIVNHRHRADTYRSALVQLLRDHWASDPYNRDDTFAYVPADVLAEARKAVASDG
jgi:hypothetical protein